MTYERGRFRVSRFAFRVSSRVNPKPETRNPTLSSRRGQALIELALFGSFIILVLGVLVSYGLNADLTQQAMMRTFRQALLGAQEAPQHGKPTSTAHVLLDDRHIPNPSHPFAVGSVFPITASSGGITRNWKLQEVGNTIPELSRLFITIQGQPIDCPSDGQGCTTAGFRTEKDVPEDSLDRYVEIYGRRHVCEKPECGGERTCVKEDEDTGQCVRFALQLRIIDACEGEIIGLDGCTRQARQMVDSGFCATVCEKGKLPGSELDCAAVCSHSMNRPWYAQDAFKDQNGVWVFPKLNTLVGGRDLLGLQPGSVRRAMLDTTLDRTEGSSSVRTSSTIDTWQNQTTRQFSHAAKPVDYTQDPDNPLAVTRTDRSVTSTKGEPSTTTWTTPW